MTVRKISLMIEACEECPMCHYEDSDNNGNKTYFCIKLDDFVYPDLYEIADNCPLPEYKEA